jgi:hypothetical protein
VPRTSTTEEIDMKPSWMLAAVLAASVAPVAHAADDPATRMLEMQSMDADRDGLVSRKEFLAAIAKLWDAKSSEMKVRGGRMTPEQLRELEKLLGRSLGADAR